MAKTEKVVLGGVELKGRSEAANDYGRPEDAREYLVAVMSQTKDCIGSTHFNFNLVTVREKAQEELNGGKVSATAEPGDRFEMLNVRSDYGPWQDLGYLDLSIATLDPYVGDQDRRTNLWRRFRYSGITIENVTQAQRCARVLTTVGRYVEKQEEEAGPAQTIGWWVLRHLKALRVCAVGFEVPDEYKAYSGQNWHTDNYHWFAPTISVAQRIDGTIERWAADTDRTVDVARQY